MLIVVTVLVGIGILYMKQNQKGCFKPKAAPQDGVAIMNESLPAAVHPYTRAV